MCWILAIYQVWIDKHLFEFHNNHNNRQIASYIYIHKNIYKLQTSTVHALSSLYSLPLTYLVFILSGLGILLKISSVSCDPSTFIGNTSQYFHSIVFLRCKDKVYIIFTPLADSTHI